MFYFKGFLLDNHLQNFNFLFPIYINKTTEKYYATFQTETGIITEFYELDDDLSFMKITNISEIFNTEITVGSEGILGYFRQTNEIILDFYSSFITKLECLLSETTNPYEKFFLASYLKNIGLFKSAQSEILRISDSKSDLYSNINFWPFLNIQSKSPKNIDLLINLMQTKPNNVHFLSNEICINNECYDISSLTETDLNKIKQHVILNTYNYDFLNNNQLFNEFVSDETHIEKLYFSKNDEYVFEALIEAIN